MFTGESSGSFFESLTELIAGGSPLVAVTVVSTMGSVPCESGAKMLVTRDGLVRGTVGGGKIEKRALEEALSMLEPSTEKCLTRFVEWNLVRDLGMTCGGALKLYFEAFNVVQWDIVVFGAGHVANALVRMLVNLDCRITCIDPREEWLGRLPVSPKLTTVHATDMPAMVKSLPEGAFVVLMTMGHSTDSPILLEILRSRHFPYLGVIGSKAKAARLRRDVADAGLPAEAQKAFLCPIGLSIGTNEPGEIALSVAAQLLEVRDVSHRVLSRAAPSP